MSTKEFLNRYIKRNNFLEDFTKIDQRGGFNHRYSGKDTNGNVSDLLLDEKIEICDGMDFLIEKAIKVRDELKDEIKNEQNKVNNDVKIIENLQSLTEFHHSGGELKAGMEGLLEIKKHPMLTQGILKDWKICEVERDFTGYKKYLKSSLTVEVNGMEKEYPFERVYYVNV
jgi:hypothetical protein